MPEVTTGVELLFADSAGNLRSFPVLSLSGVDAPREHAVVVYKKTDGTLAISSLDELLSSIGAKLDTLNAKDFAIAKDYFTGGQALADQTPNGAPATFSFASPVQLVWVRCDGGSGRADPFGGTPDASTGILCEDGVPQPITVQTSSVKVFAAVGVTVRVWGFRY